jgi:transcriptional regulator with XRE-family HTH domain
MRYPWHCDIESGIIGGAVKSAAAASLIHDARIRAGLSQRQLARRAKTSQAVISAYENGRRDPGFAHTLEILRAAGFDLDMRLMQPIGDGSPARSSRDIWWMPDSGEDDDRILENLRLSPTARLRKLGAMRSFASKYRGSARRLQ